MKKRLLSAAIGLPLVAVILCFFQTIIFNIAISLVGAIFVFEIFHSAKALHDRDIVIASMIYALLFPFSSVEGWINFRGILTVCYIFFLFAVLLYRYEKISVERITFLGAMTLLLSYSLWTLVAIRDAFASYGLYYLLLVFALSWICDMGAYFTGRAFGKHKMAPKISPNKTVEGVVGGLAINFVFAAILTAIFAIWVYSNVKISILSWIVLVLLGSFLGIIGDLSASAIKRQLGIKDFGNLLPGHGGAIDRFDSLLFVSVAVYFVGSVLPVFV